MAHLAWTPEDEPLFASVRALKRQNIEWSSQLEIIKNYRARLLELQNQRCAYCQATIESTATGYVELDHILPKLPNGTVAERLVSNDFDDRRVTSGYIHFTYEPRNLVITCKACNSVKGTFDPCTDRLIKLSRYPTNNSVSRLLTWYHPHFHDYSDHISRNPDWTYSHVTLQGDFTIRACKLNLPEELQKRFQVRADASLEHSPNIKVAITALATSVLQRRYGKEQAVVTNRKMQSISS